MHVHPWPTTETLASLFQQLAHSALQSLPVSQDPPPGHADDSKAEPSKEGENEPILEHISDGGVLAAAEDRALARRVVSDHTVHVALHNITPLVPWPPACPHLGQVMRTNPVL